MAAEISANELISLGRYAQRVGQLVDTAVQVSTQKLQDDIRSRARMLPGWDQMADKIEVWSLDGQWIIGVRDQDYVSEAMALEYGDETRPPSPLLRTLNSETEAAEGTFAEMVIEGGAAKPWQLPI